MGNAMPLFHVSLGRKEEESGSLTEGKPLGLPACLAPHSKREPATQEEVAAPPLSSAGMCVDA